MYAKHLKIYPAYPSKHVSKREKQIIPLIIPDKEGWNYVAVKKLLALLRGITSKYKGYDYCFDCLNFFRTKNKLKSRTIVFENKTFCNVVIPSEDAKILGINQYFKSDKAPFFIYGDLESLIVKIDGCKNNPEKS